MYSLPSEIIATASAGARARRFVLAAALVLAAAPAEAQDTGKTAFEAYVAGMEQLGLDISNGAVDYDEASDTLTLRDSKMSFSGVIRNLPLEEMDVTGNDGQTDIDPSMLTDLTYDISFTSGTVAITGLTHDDNAFAAKSWTYSDDTEFLMTGAAEGKGQAKVEGRMTGARILNYSFVIPDVPAEDPDRQASRWLPFMRAALQASYDDFTVDNIGMTIEARETTDGEDKLVLSGTTQVDGMRVKDVVDGAVSEYSIDQTTQSIQTANPEDGQMLVQTTSQGKSIYRNVNAAALLDLMDPAVPENGEEVILIESGSAVTYESSQEVAPGVAIAIGVDKASVEDVTVIKRDNNLLSLLDDLMKKKAPAPEDLISGVFQYYRSFAVADARISGISVRMPTPGPQAGVDLSIREMAMTEMSSSGIGEMMIVGLDAPDLPGGASVTLDWAALGDIEFADFGPMREMIGTLTADPEYGERNPMQVARAFLPRSAAYEIEGLDVSMPDFGRTQIGKAEMSLATTVPPIPTSLYFKNDDIRFPVSAIEDQAARELMASLGLDEVVWSDETRLYWDEATLDLRLERMKLEIEGLGTAELTARFANVPKTLFEDPQGQGQMAVVVAQFVDASLVFRDNGLTSKGLAHVAGTQGIPENVFREALVAQAAEATAPIGNEAFTNMVREAASDFLNNPGELKVTLSPQGPVPLAQILGSMAAPQSLPDLLNVKVVAAAN